MMLKSLNVLKSLNFCVFQQLDRRQCSSISLPSSDTEVAAVTLDYIGDVAITDGSLKQKNAYLCLPSLDPLHQFKKFKNDWSAAKSDAVWKSPSLEPSYSSNSKRLNTRDMRSC